MEHRFPDFRYVAGNCETRFRVWLKKLTSELVKLTFLATALGLGCIGGLYFLRGSWFLFKDTAIGARYIEIVNAAGAARLSSVLSLDFIELTLIVMLLTVIVCLKVGVISQLTMLRRFFYVGRSALVKLGWAGLVCALIAPRLVEFYPMSFSLAFGLCFLPTIGILSAALASSGKLFPELNLLLFWENLRQKREVKEIKNDIARIMEERGRE
ncbi:MAG: hypothetical protein RQ753_10470 [Desulfurivibrionaceae bacterium]|nr:hypothetical protein [Desulfurivibrionaceae bacterium]